MVAFDRAANVQWSATDYDPEYAIAGGNVVGYSWDTGTQVTFDQNGNPISIGNDTTVDWSGNLFATETSFGGIASVVRMGQATTSAFSAADVSPNAFQSLSGYFELSGWAAGIMRLFEPVEPQYAQLPRCASGDSQSSSDIRECNAHGWTATTKGPGDWIWDAKIELAKSCEMAA